MTAADLRRRVKPHGFGLVKQIDPEATGRRFLIFERSRWFLIQGYHRPLTAEEVEAFVTDMEDHWLSGDP